MLECWDDGILMEVSSHTFVGWCVGVGGPHPSKRQTLNIFNEEVVDIYGYAKCKGIYIIFK
jgi:hypothetical protein